MKSAIEKITEQSVKVLLTLCLLAVAASSQQSTLGTVRGRVVDALGALVRDANVVVVSADGAEKTAQTNQEGEFIISNLVAGKYTVRVQAEGFAVYENAAVELTGSRAVSLDIILNVAATEAAVTIGEEEPINTNPEANSSAIVLQQRDIEALPDNEAELEAALQALAGPGAGPNGGEIFIDGFSGGKLPPRDSIREIRINQNPFSSEYDRLGLGRIEILTKPGTDEFNGELEFEFEDESLNSRNPFAQNRASFQVRNIEGNVGGPIVKNRASFFVDFGREASDNNALINALILDPNLNAAPFQRAVLTPSKELEFSPRFDVQINPNNTLVGRYFYERSNSLNDGLGGFDLLSRGFNSNTTEQTVRLTETSVISGSVINETRFQYIRRRNTQDGSDNNSPTVRVLDAFTGGGANIGAAFSNEDRYELQNYTSFVRGRHSFRVGGRLRAVRLDNSSPNNFAGTFTFTSLDQYRNTILNTPGATPTQFTVAGGNPEAGISQTDLGIFLQDDWRVNSQLTLSFGLRYETQNNISSNLNFAPRFNFAYAPGANGNNRPKTVFRGGIGVFYDRFGEGLTLQALRFNGINQQQFIVTDPTILDSIVFTSNGSISNIPTVQSLTAFAQPQTTRIVAPDLQSPYTIQTAVSVERQLSFKTTLSATYVNASTRRLLRSRNVNAPVGGVRPIPASGNIFQYESTARFNQNQLIFNFRSNFLEDVSIFGNYAFSGAKSDSDGAGSFPANSNDLSGEYGNAALDVRHRFVVGGNFETLFGVSFSPFVSFRSGVPFNLTTGADSNGDSIFAERPALATNLSEPGIVITRFGAFDPTPDAGDVLVPRNFGRGEEFFVVNLRTTKEFGFGGKKNNAAAQAQNGNSGGGGNRGGVNSPFGGGQQNRGGDDDDDDSPYTIELSMQIRNLFNRTNKGTPIGNLRSPFFGEPVSLAGGFGFGGGGSGQAGNRRIEFELQFSF